jgi:hypothetical protein
MTVLPRHLPTRDVAGKMTSRPADNDTPISGQYIEEWGTQFWELVRSRSYQDLTYYERIWLWDFARTVHQMMGKKVNTPETWVCQVAPPEIPIKTAADLIESLNAATLKLSAHQPAIARAIMSSIDFVRRIRDDEAMKDYKAWHAKQESADVAEFPEEAWEVHLMNEAFYEYTMSHTYQIEEFINDLERVTDFPANDLATLRAAVWSADHAVNNGHPDAAIKAAWAKVLLNEAERFFYETVGGS